MPPFARASLYRQLCGVVLHRTTLPPGFRRVYPSFVSVIFALIMRDMVTPCRHVYNELFLRILTLSQLPLPFGSRCLLLLLPTRATFHSGHALQDSQLGYQVLKGPFSPLLHCAPCFPDPEFRVTRNNRILRS